MHDDIRPHATPSLGVMQTAVHCSAALPTEAQPSASQNDRTDFSLCFSALWEARVLCQRLEKKEIEARLEVAVLARLVPPRVPSRPCQEQLLGR